MKVKTNGIISGLILITIISLPTFSSIGCGRRDGPSNEHYANGKLKSERTFKDSKLEGLCRWYYENGQLKTEGVFKNGEAVGEVKYYEENGKPKELTPYHPVTPAQKE